MIDEKNIPGPCRYLELIDGEEYERTKFDRDLETYHTQRGFSKIRFHDRYGSRCSLQASSLGTEAAIWFGVDKPFDEENEYKTRMHLTKDMVQALLPMLIRFAEQGELFSVKEISNIIVCEPSATQESAK